MRFWLTQVCDGIFHVWNFVIVFFNLGWYLRGRIGIGHRHKVRSTQTAPASTWLAKQA
jgi:hypothetical protein